MFEHAAKLQFEGIVSKRVDAPYRSERTEAWLKIKTVQTEKFPVIGFVKDPTGVAALYLGKDAAIAATARRFTPGGRGRDGDLLTAAGHPEHSRIVRHTRENSFPRRTHLAWYRKNPSDNRRLVSRERLQSAVTKAVKKADPQCQDFVGVIVQRETPKAGFDADWAVRGVRFGKADRDKCSLVLATIAELMQREFSLAAHFPGSAEKSDELESDV
jgi:hypothetical protein